MGRNAIPKLGEWREGSCYRFRVVGRAYRGTEGHVPNPEDGRTIVYERLTLDGTEILGSCFADGFQECMASMYHVGYDKGRKAGRKELLAELRRTLGIQKGE